MKRTDSKTVLLLGSYAPSLIKFRGPLIADMIEAGHNVVAAAPDIDPATARALRDVGAEPKTLSLRRASLNPFGALATLRAMRALIRETKPDVVIGYTIKPVIFGSLAAHAEGVPRVVALVTGLGFAFTEGQGVKRAVSRVAASLLYRAALRRAHIVLFQNPDDQALFLRSRLLDPRKPTALVNGSGVDLQLFPSSRPPPAPSFLMIARLLKDKGVREFGIAAARLKAERPEVRISLAGYFDAAPDAIAAKDLERMVQAGVDYLGHLEDVRPALAEHSVYVLPSYREGTPRSSLEAMATGRALITTDVPGCRETVDGTNGLLVPPRDADALYEAMIGLVRDPSRIPAMGLASRALAEARFEVHEVNREVMRHAGLTHPYGSDIDLRC